MRHPLLIAIGTLLVLGSLLALGLISSGEHRKGVDFEKRSIVTFMTSEPPTLDTTDKVTSIGFNVQGQTLEGLMHVDEKGMLQPGTASHYELSPDGLSYTFHLRPEARWSDGSQVSAYDFEFAWQTVCNPARASEYSFIMAMLANHSKVLKKELPPEALGVKALDSATLQVTLSNPCPYFLSLTTFVSFLPVKKDLYIKLRHIDAQGVWIKNEYASSADKMLYNGPFVISEWTQNKRITLTKNPLYWNKDAIWLNEIDYGYITSDLRTVFNLYVNGDICSAGADVETVRDSLKANHQIKSFALGALCYLEFNHRAGRIGADKNFRQALQSVISPDEVCNKVIGLPGYIPGVSLVPLPLRSGDLSFREQCPLDPLPIDSEKGRALLKGLKLPSEISMLIGDDDRSKQIGAFIQNTLQTKLGIRVKIDVQTFKARLDKAHKGDFDIMVTNWGPDYDDPMTFIDLLLSSNDNNHGAYKDAAYDALVEQGRCELDFAKRLKLLDQAQKMIQRDAVILPLFETGTIWTHHPRVTGIQRAIIGPDPCFMYSRILEKAP